MANLVIDPTEVRMIKEEYSITLPAGVAINAGQSLTISATTGKFILAEDDNICAIAINSKHINGAVTGLVKGELELGGALSGNFQKFLYSSDDPGAVSLLAGDSTATTVIGYVVPSHAGALTGGIPALHRIARIDIPLLES